MSEVFTRREELHERIGKANFQFRDRDNQIIIDYWFHRQPYGQLHSK